MLKLHTVTLDTEKCRGCVTCMKRCPTEAIRVRDGKASIIYDLCISCGECVRLCPHHAKKPAYDSFDTIFNYKYRIALPAPSLYAQFPGLKDVNEVLNGLLSIGFDDVYEVGRAAELVSEATKILFNRDAVKLPAISTACPVVLELILARHHNMLENLLPLQAPADIAAKLAREQAIAKGVPAEDIGVFFISPCPAKVLALKEGFGLEKPGVEGVLAVGDVYMRLQTAIKNQNTGTLKPLSKMGKVGMSWAQSGGEANGIYNDRFLAADGIENVIDVLTALENKTLSRVDFVELNACPGGCVGGVLNVENPFIAKARIQALNRLLPDHLNTLASEGKSLAFYQWEKTPDTRNVLRLDEDRAEAMQKMINIKELCSTLPLVDCGLCGAPSCMAFSEDKVNGRIAKEAECPRLLTSGVSAILTGGAAATVTAAAVSECDNCPGAATCKAYRESKETGKPPVCPKRKKKAAQ